MRGVWVVVLVALAGCGGSPRLRPFTTDGCSLFPDGTASHKDLWLKCCTEHDYKYWLGGTRAERLKADLDLQACVASVGKPTLAAMMLRGVRAGGTPYLPTSFRWGYGWRYPRGYDPLSDDEKRLVAATPRP